jgi:hypothetical protein
VPDRLGVTLVRAGGGAPTAIASFAGGKPQILTVIEGTSSWGDIILAGAGNDSVHANDGHTDRVDCGPGRDTVWADRSDRLTGCEIVYT